MKKAGIDWVAKGQRMPGPEDADAYGCVLIYDRLNGVKVTGWRNEQELRREAVTHWAPMPEGPAKGKEWENGR